MENHNNFNVSRRKFLQNSGHLIVGFNLIPFLELKDTETDLWGDTGKKNIVDSWITLNADGVVTVLTGKMELGQGIKTALMQIAAEELDVAMEKVKIVIADTARTQDERYTAGSASIEGSGKAIRNAAAEARRYLLSLAEKKIGTTTENLFVENGKVISKTNQQTVSYQELINGRRFEIEVTGKAPVKSPQDYKLIGKPIPRKDLSLMVSAQPYYVQDLRFPDMVHARVLRPPTYNAKLLSLPKSEVLALPGVLKVVLNGSFVAVITTEEYQSIKALNRMKQLAKWKTPSISPLQKDLYTDILNNTKSSETVEEEGNVEEALATDSKKHESIYKRPYQIHGSIGPSCAIGLWENKKLTIWTHSQGVYPLRKTLSDLLKISEDNIRTIGVPGAGCYGHNGADDVAADAALLAVQMEGKHVRVQWMREDEHTWEPFGSAMIFKLKASMDDSGKINSWYTELWSDTHSSRPGGKAGHFIAARDLEKPFYFQTGGFSGGSHRNSIPLYNLKNRKVVLHNFKGPLRTSALRSLGAYANIFALESFMDELAEKAGKDPVQFRLEHLTDDRAREVITTLVDKAGWRKNKQVNFGEGIAFAQYKNAASYFAVKAEVTIDPVKKTFKVTKLTGAIDAGQTINSDGIINQTSGGMIQAASWTLLEQVLYDEKGVQSKTWERYPILRFEEVPDTEVILIDRPEKPPLGAGEAAQGPTAAAIANAIFHATGSRLREMPLTADKIDWTKV